VPTESQQEILDLLKGNKILTTQQIMDATGKSRATVWGMLRRLKRDKEVLWDPADDEGRLLHSQLDHKWMGGE
jgi:DNA-binding IclR family transcriptional regulator